jgi:hypothetical protein
MVFLITLLNKPKVLIPCEISIQTIKHGSYFYLFHIPKFWDVTGEEAPTSTTHQQVVWRHCPECREAGKHHLLKFGSLLLD